jgi:hypothetical protein
MEVAKCAISAGCRASKIIRCGGDLDGGARVTQALLCQRCLSVGFNPDVCRGRRSR